MTPAIHVDTGVFEPAGFELSVDKVLRMAGYRDLDSVRPNARALAGSATRLAQNAFSPTVHYTRIGIASLDQDRIRLVDGTTFESPVFAKYLKYSSEIVAAVLTVGQQFDDVGRDLAGDDKIVETLFLESAGWLGIEETTNAFRRHLQDMVACEGLELTRRLSPGYGFRVGREKCLWKIEDQKALFDLFAPGKLPVKILESCAMIPKMSRSGIFGLRPRKADSQNAT